MIRNGLPLRTNAPPSKRKPGGLAAGAEAARARIASRTDAALFMVISPPGSFVAPCDSNISRGL